MKKQYREIIKREFRNSLLKTRASFGLTQEQMAPKLYMSVRAYCGLESGENGCGTLTLVIYLLFVCEDPIELLEKLRTALEIESSEAA